MSDMIIKFREITDADREFLHKMFDKVHTNWEEMLYE